MLQRKSILQLYENNYEEALKSFSGKGMACLFNIFLGYLLIIKS
ncbi:MAG: hypothetical protein K0S44_2583 [Bacteroidetes bacterium]|jgi:hypothetical protein|nr:hypothetical protein [Bacteroidota bacterium]